MSGLVRSELTHEDLRKMAVKWLTVTGRCAVVLSELVAYTHTCEVPDAIGWYNGTSMLIECKVSRSDFFRNAEKIAHRNGMEMMGNRRYFLTPKGLVTEVDMARFPGYGLLEVTESGSVKVAIQPVFKAGATRDEIAMLVSALRRIKTREFITLNTCDCHKGKGDE